MRLLWILLCAAFLLPVQPALSGTTLSDLLLLKETQPRVVLEAQQAARTAGFPVNLYLPEGVLLEVLAFENGAPLYGVITNLAHPLEEGRTATYDEIRRTYNLSAAHDLTRGPVPITPGSPRRTESNGGLLLVPDWTADRVMAFDPVTGNLVDTNFIPSTPGTLQSPKEALGSPRGTITVSDQLSDAVQDFDTSGSYIGIFAPAGGVNPAILDNIRGHAYRANGNLVVTVASGTNTNSIAEFDSTGAYIGNFVGNAVGGLNSPFGILFRDSDVLITQSSATQGVKQFDLNGGYLSQWATITSFPQQIIELESGNIAVANFSGTGEMGVRLYTSTGVFQRVLSGVTGNRGVYQLPSGNFLTTNGAGIHEIDSVTGGLVRTILASASLQYITPYVPGTVNEVRLLSPNGGESLTVGDTTMITWTVVGAVDSVRLEYSTDNGSAWSPIGVFSGSAEWIVPDEPTLEGLVRATWIADSTVTDVSDAPFAIVQGGTVARSYEYGPGWHLVSVPLVTADNSTAALFPGASSPAYAYQGGYVTRDSLDVGEGYWIKFPSPQTVTMVGYPVLAETVDVVAGWNLVGSLTDSVEVADVTSIPTGIIASNFFGYTPLGYAPAEYLLPSRGYWVKVSQAGQIVLRHQP